LFVLFELYFISEFTFPFSRSAAPRSMQLQISFCKPYTNRPAAPAALQI
jgi:hypothetical protein